MSISCSNCKPSDGLSDLDEAAFAAFVATVRQQSGSGPFELALVLGSGLGRVFAAARPLAVFPYAEHPVFPPTSRVAGHAGEVLAVEWQGRRVLLFRGRFHLYQGLSAWQASVPVRIAAALGCRKLLLTSAVGGIHAELLPGSLLYLRDHLNLTGDNPLRGLPGPPFISLTELYCGDFLAPLQRHAATIGARLCAGVLAALPGPSYETPAEIRMLERLGADAVGMSLVPEAIMAKALGMEVVGLSLVTNQAAGIGGSSPGHAEVLATAEQSAAVFAGMCEELCRLWLR